jgi:hypothetical protein
MWWLFFILFFINFTNQADMEEVRSRINPAVLTKLFYWDDTAVFIEPSILSKIPLDDFSYLIRNTPTLNQCHFVSANLNDKRLHALFDAVIDNISIKEVMFNIETYTTIDVEILATAFRRNTHISSFTLNHVREDGLSMIDFMPLLHALFTNSFVHDVELFGFFFDEIIPGIGDWISTNTSIVCLSFERCTISYINLQRLYESIQRNHTLKKININECIIEYMNLYKTWTNRIDR